MHTAGGNLDCIRGIAGDIGIDAPLQSATEGLEFRRLSGFSVEQVEIVGGRGIENEEFRAFRANLRKSLQAAVYGKLAQGRRIEAMGRTDVKICYMPFHGHKAALIARALPDEIRTWTDGLNIRSLDDGHFEGSISWLVRFRVKD